VGKASAARYYLPAWMVWVIALMAYVVALEHQAGNPFHMQDLNIMGLTLIIEVLAVTMILIWVSVLVRLRRLHAWGWFVAVFVLHLVGLGVLAIGAYSMLGPADVDVSRPGVE
jgi:hypothetical protein